jgi:hypothetical protein
VRLDLADALGADLFEALDPVGTGALGEVGEARELVGRDRDDELPAVPVGYAPFIGELFYRRFSFAA